MSAPRRLGLAAMAVTAVVCVAAGCESRSAETPEREPPTTTAVTAPADPRKPDMPPEPSAPDPSVPEAGTTSSRRAVVETDGGSVVVTADGSELVVVSLTTNEGWEVAVDRPDPGRLEASFTRAGGRAVVSIVLTEAGITSSTRSETTG